MSIALVGTATATTAHSSSVTVAKPTGAASGDLLILLLGCESSSYATPSGFSLIGGGGDTSAPVLLYAFSRVLDGTEGSSFTFTGQGYGSSLTAVCLSGAAATPTGFALEYTDSNRSGSQGIPGQTSPAAGSLIIASVFDGGSTTAPSTPPGLTKLVSSNDSDTHAVTWSVVSTGSTVGPWSTFIGGNDSLTTVSFVVAPAAGGGGSPATASGALSLTGSAAGVASAAGAGSLSLSGSATAVAATPGPPSGATAVAGNAAATVSFVTPTTNLGVPIDYYTITSSPGGFTATVYP